MTSAAVVPPENTIPLQQSPQTQGEDEIEVIRIFFGPLHFRRYELNKGLRAKQVNEIVADSLKLKSELRPLFRLFLVKEEEDGEGNLELYCLYSCLFDSPLRLGHLVEEDQEFVQPQPGKSKGFDH